ncbi:MAG: type II toxin-antitoxin system VapC family toxin [Actinomycetota bacterium]|nr:type II toxin-antitoxin system VapC family toxin [Actinomycetota bacterium]
MIVVDASAAISALLNAGPARAALADEQAHAPHLIDPEVANALRRGVARSLIEPGDARSALERWRRLGLLRHATFPLLERVWQLRDNLSAYDASYVALAEALGCALLSADARIARSPEITCPVTIVPR